MYISTETGSLHKIFETYEEKLTALSYAGFDAYDFTMCGYCTWTRDENYVAKASDLRKFADGTGIACNQTHAPYPLVYEADKKRTAERFDEIVRSLEITSILGAKLCVVHPWNNYTPQQNAQIYKRLEPYARKFGVMIALENMWNWNWGEPDEHAQPAACSDENSFNAHLDLLDGEIFCAVADIGHAEMFGLNTSAASMIKSLGKRIKGIHLHDNDRKNDSHMLPFTSRIDFNSVIDALKEIDYQGDITLESNSYLPRFPKALIPDALKMMATTADYFRKELQKRR